MYAIYYGDILLYTVTSYEKAVAMIRWFRERGMEVEAIEL